MGHNIVHPFCRHHLRACVITHNDLLYTQKTHSNVADSPSIVIDEEEEDDDEGKIIYLFINSLSIIVPMLAACAAVMCILRDQF